MTFQYSGGEYVVEEFHYQIYDPREDGSTEQQYPCSSGYMRLGEAGDDNTSHLRWIGQLLMPSPWERKRHRFLCLGDPVSANQRVVVPTRWKRGRRHGVGVDSDRGANAQSKYPIDRDRVYVTGVSSGGKGSWIFPSAAQIYCRGRRIPYQERTFDPTPSCVAALKQIPIWTFNCSEDGASEIDMVRFTVEAVAKAGGRIHLTEIPIASHDSWTDLHPLPYDLQELDVVAQRRDSTTAPVPGTVSCKLAICVNVVRNIFRHRFFI